jgi:hypothetical protein
MNPVDTASPLDIGHLQGFSIPGNICQTCRAISRSETRCDVCGATTVKDLNPTVIPFASGVQKKVGDRFRHAEGFAAVVPMGKRFWDAATVIKSICAHSQLYIHLVTYSIDVNMLRILESALLRGVQVAGFIGCHYGPEASAAKKITAMKAAYPALMNLTIWAHQNPSSQELAPHQKLLICDGCVAITGSMNFTEAAFRKQDADMPSEFVWTFTDARSVIAINNQYISPLFVPHLGSLLRGR